MILKILIILFLIILGATQVKAIYICKKCDRKKICYREVFVGVCGWFSENVRCKRYPCARTYGTICQACSNRNVAYVTKGVCLGDIIKTF